MLGLFDKLQEVQTAWVQGATFFFFHPFECKFRGSKDFGLVCCYVSARQIADSRWICFK